MANFSVIDWYAIHLLSPAMLKSYAPGSGSNVVASWLLADRRATKVSGGLQRTAEALVKIRELERGGIGELESWGMGCCDSSNFGSDEILRVTILR